MDVAANVLKTVCLYFNLEPPVGRERAGKILVWATALKNIPVEEIMPLVDAELCERESSFVILPADLVKRWNSMCGMAPEGAGNVSAYQRYVDSDTRALPAPLVPLQIDPQELKRRLGAPSQSQGREAEATRSSNMVPALGERWSGMLLDIAKAGNIDLDRCTPEQITELSSLGQWWLANHPYEDVLQHNFSAVYQEFCGWKSQREI